MLDRYLLLSFALLLPTRTNAQHLASVDAGTACGRENTPAYTMFSENCDRSVALAFSPMWLGNDKNWTLSFRTDATTRAQPGWNDGLESNTYVEAPTITQRDRLYLGGIVYGTEFATGSISSTFFGGVRLSYTHRSVDYAFEYASGKQDERYRYFGAGPVIGMSSSMSLAQNWSVVADADAAILIGTRKNAASIWWNFDGLELKQTLKNTFVDYQASIGGSAALVWEPFDRGWSVGIGFRATHWLNFVSADYAAGSRGFSVSGDWSLDRTIYSPFIRITISSP